MSVSFCLLLLLLEIGSINITITNNKDLDLRNMPVYLTLSRTRNCINKQLKID